MAIARSFFRQLISVANRKSVSDRELPGPARKNKNAAWSWIHTAFHSVWSIDARKADQRLDVLGPAEVSAEQVIESLMHFLVGVFASS